MIILIIRIIRLPRKKGKKGYECLVKWRRVRKFAVTENSLSFMNLKSILALICLALGVNVASWAYELPQFSNGTTENWYYIVFANKYSVIQDFGVDKNMMSNNVVPDRETQLWKFVGDEDGFKMMNAAGRYARLDDKLVSTDNEESAGIFRLVRNTHPDMGEYFDIVDTENTSGYNHLQTYSGAGVGRLIGGWEAADINNAVFFYPKGAMSPEAPKVKEYASNGLATFAPENRHTAWYTKPATGESVEDQWMEYALPVGNGQFGAMTFGGVACDRVQFNEKTLWSGTSHLHGTYENFGNVYLEDLSDVFNTSDKALKNYVRYLDMDNGISEARYSSPDGTTDYLRQYIASYPDKVVAIHLTATNPGKISQRITLVPGMKSRFVTVAYSADGTATIEDKFQKLDFKAKLKVVATGGEMTVTDAGIEVKGADELLVVLTGATNFDQHSPTYTSSVAGMKADVDAVVSAAAAKSWDSLLADHQADYKALWDRSEFVIDAAANTKTVQDMVTTYNKRRADRTAPEHLMLEELYYAMGRYMLIGCSRGIDQPSNLQGIWNHSSSPAWDCDIHSNINVQMNQWPTEITNLSELHMPYLNYVYSMALEHNEWADYAQRSGQSKGWTCFTQNNIFGYSDYAENYVIANAWYAYHFWQHYIYTLDKDFLVEKALPVMVSCCEFWLERLVKASDGTWEAPKEWSPEHGPQEENATAHAQQILVELFKDTLAALKEAGSGYKAPDGFEAELQEKYENLDKGLATEVYNGWGTANGVADGTEVLREWKYSPLSVGEDGHRHQSHLMAMFPFDQITPESPYFKPAINSLTQRGDLSTGWSLGWRINLWARALDAEHAHKVIVTALRHSNSYGQSNGAGGIYYNLFDSHAPFQIDGNFGYTAGVTEMLLQSYGGEIRLLPALPSMWKGGQITGIRGVNNFEIDQKWAEGKLTQAVITSNSGKDCTVIYPAIAEKASVKDETGADVQFENRGADKIVFPTRTGGVYTISYDDGSGIDQVAADVDDENAPKEYFNLQGMRVAEPANGIFIVKQGSKVSKEVIK